MEWLGWAQVDGHTELAARRLAAESVAVVADMARVAVAA